MVVLYFFIFFYLLLFLSHFSLYYLPLIQFCMTQNVVRYVKMPPGELRGDGGAEAVGIPVESFHPGVPRTPGAGDPGHFQTPNPGVFRPPNPVVSGFKNFRLMC